MSLSITFEKTGVSSNEQQIILSDYTPSGSIPLTITALPIMATLSILVLWRSTGISGQVSGIRSGLTALGYSEGSDFSITSKILTDTYTGAGDIDLPSAYNVIFIGTDSGTRGATAFGTRLNTFLAAGNHIVMTTFAWNLYISQVQSGFFSYATYSPLVGTGNQSTLGSQTLTVNQVHPITTGLDLNVGSISYNNNTSLQSGATLLASYSNGDEAIAIITPGSSRCVAINFYPPNLSNSSLVNQRNIVVNAILWCIGFI